MRRREEKDVYRTLNVLSDNGHELKLTQRHREKRENHGH